MHLKETKQDNQVYELIRDDGDKIQYPPFKELCEKDFGIA